MVRGECETILELVGRHFLAAADILEGAAATERQSHDCDQAARVRVVRRIIGILLPPIMALSGRAFFLSDQGIDQHKPDTDHDRRVGDIEGRASAIGARGNRQNRTLRPSARDR
jgi:hypothetical protein